MEHFIKLIEGINISMQSTARCSCGWSSADGPRSQVAEEARLHQEGEGLPWVIPPGTLRSWGEPDRS